MRADDRQSGLPAGESAEAPGPLGVGQAVLVSVALGMLFGLIEPPLVVLRRFGLGVPVFTSPQIVWGAPLGYALLFLPIGVGLAVAGKAWAPLGRPRTVVLLLTFLGSFGLLQVFRVELYTGAAVVLALGLSWRAAEAANAAPRRLLGVARRGLAPMCLAIGALTVVVNGVPVLQERRALAGLGPAPEGSPNVILIILDTVRSATMSLYGHPEPTTPYLDDFARSAVVFERAVATSSWSNPSHAGIFTGRYPHEVSSGWESGLDGAHLTIAEAFRNAGYRTSGFSANIRYVTRETGMSRGFARFEDHRPLSLDGALATTWAGRTFTDRGRLIPRALSVRDTPGRKAAPHVLEPMLEWIDEAGDRPFFAMANLMDAHAAYLPSEPYATRFGAVPMPGLGARVVRRLRQLARLPTGPVPNGREVEAYRGAVAELDAHLGDFFTRLEARGVLDNTVVIITSDHGEEFLEHGVYGHGVSLYWPSIWVPLIVRLPGGDSGGLRVSEPVSLRSIPVSAVDIAGLPNPGFPAGSLARAWNGAGVAGDTVLSELPYPQPAGIRTGPALPAGPMRSAVVGSLHLIRFADGSEELFDVSADPWEQADILGRSEAATLEALRALVGAAPSHPDSAMGGR